MMLDKVKYVYAYTRISPKENNGFDTGGNVGSRKIVLLYYAFFYNYLVSIHVSELCYVLKHLILVDMHIRFFLLLWFCVITYNG